MMPSMIMLCLSAPISSFAKSIIALPSSVTTETRPRVYYVPDPALVSKRRTLSGADRVVEEYAEVRCLVSAELNMLSEAVDERQFAVWCAEADVSRGKERRDHSRSDVILEIFRSQFAASVA